MGLKYLYGEGKSKDEKKEKWFKDFEIEEMLKLPSNTVVHITGSAMVSYTTDDRQYKIVDTGLNLKNTAKKMHVPGYVKLFVPKDPEMQPSWRYSKECVELLANYHELFGEAFLAMAKR
jgi:hypothetical protein